jgi:hypothetical protein
MALVAHDATDRVEQLIILSEKLTALISEETSLIEARKPLPTDGRDEERNRLVNAYRLEMARIKQDPELIVGAAPLAVAALKRATAILQDKLARYERALEAVRIISEGLLRAMAEAAAEQAAGPRTYAASGGYDQPAASAPSVALNQRA